MSEQQRDWHAILSIRSCRFDCTVDYKDPFKWETVPIGGIGFRVPVPLWKVWTQGMSMELLGLCRRKGWKEYCCLHIDYGHPQFSDCDCTIPIASSLNKDTPLIHYCLTDDPVVSSITMGTIVELLQGRILNIKKETTTQINLCFKVALKEDEDPETKRLALENNLKEMKLLKDDEHVEIRENDNNN